jgi:hypothetical protein
MSARNISREAVLRQLRASYKKAFDEWAYTTTRLQLVIRISADADAIKQAQQRVAAAHAAYRETRDRLASSLVDLRCAEPVQGKCGPVKIMMSAVHP